MFVPPRSTPSYNIRRFSFLALLYGQVGAQQNILCIIAKLELKFSGFYPPYIIRAKGTQLLWSDGQFHPTAFAGRKR